MSAPAPGPRPIGVRRMRRDGLLTVHAFRYRSLADGQAVRIAARPCAEDTPPSNHHRKHQHVDIVVPDLDGEHSSGLILRFAEPIDIAVLRGALDVAEQLLETRRPAPEEVNLDEVPA